MPFPEFTPWFDKSELLRVRTWLYAGPYHVPWSKDPDRRKEACSLVIDPVSLCFNYATLRLLYKYLGDI